MVFNWFRRKYDENESDEQIEPQTSPTESEAVTSQPEAQTLTPAPASSQEAEPSEDLLKWAKAAYVNIQQREIVPEIAPETVPEATEEVQPESASIDLDRSVIAKSTPETPQLEVQVEMQAGSEPIEIPEPDPESIEPEPQIAEQIESIEATSELAVEPVITPEPAEVLEPVVEITEPIAESEAREEIIPESIDTPVEISAEPESVAAGSEELPFWMQSETDRQARIAALAADAIEDEQPETSQKAPVKAAPLKPFINFDEGFIWSAEILASQGRRPEDISIEEITWLKRLRQGLDKTRLSLVNQLKALVGQGPINADAVDRIESILLQADVGVKATDDIIQALQDKLKTEVLPPDEAIAYLKLILKQLLDAPLDRLPNTMLVPEKNQLNIWLITGVNGAGKTTTIGKIAHLAKKSGYKTLIAAADTFRAAAVQQVQVWGDRSGIEVIANTGKNTDPAAVVFDAITAAQARGTELLLVDTAGRLQNKKNLMDELSKIRRIIDKKSAGAIVESLLVLDATLGQNGLRQAEVFSQSAGISGVVLTKLDGTAKGGVAIAVVKQLGLPIRFIGAGEGLEDLRPFSSHEFVEALLSN